MNKSLFILFSTLLTFPLYGSELCPSASESVELKINEDSRSPSESLPEIDLRIVNALLNTSEPSQTKAEKKFECPTCNKYFTRQRNLTTHKIIHTGEKPFECSFCSKNFNHKGNLTRHLREIHKRKKSFQCPYPSCNQSFERKAQLENHLTHHMIIRTGEGNFECPFCNKNFTRKDNLNIHIQSIHHKIKPFECTWCFKRFTRNHTLERHQKKHCKRKNKSKTTQNQSP